jgi:hypothetical protein
MGSITALFRALIEATAFAPKDRRRFIDEEYLSKVSLLWVRG